MHTPHVDAAVSQGTCPAQQQDLPMRGSSISNWLPAFACVAVLVGVQASGGGGLGAGRVQALLAALLSVKAISKLSR